MAVPKRRTSKSRKRLRRGHHSAAEHGRAGLSALRIAQALAPRVRLLRLLPRQEAGRGRGRLSVIRVAVDAMGGDKAPQAEIAGTLEALASLPEPFVVQLVGRTDVDRGRAGQACRRGPRPHRDPRGARRHRHGREAARRRPEEAQLERRGRPHPAEAGPVRRLPLRRQHRRHPRRLHRAARPPRRGRAGHGRHAVSHRHASPCWCSTAAPTSTARPRSWSASPTWARSTPATSCGGPGRSSGCSTSARKRRRARPSCARRTSSSSSRPG